MEYFKPITVPSLKNTKRRHQEPQFSFKLRLQFFMSTPSSMFDVKETSLRGRGLFRRVESISGWFIDTLSQNLSIPGWFIDAPTQFDARRGYCIEFNPPGQRSKKNNGLVFFDSSGVKDHIIGEFGMGHLINSSYPFSHDPAYRKPNVKYVPGFQAATTDESRMLPVFNIAPISSIDVPEGGEILADYHSYLTGILPGKTILEASEKAIFLFYIHSFLSLIMLGLDMQMS